jgi:methionyl-tRNA formyltransferase
LTLKIFATDIIPGTHHSTPGTIESDNRTFLQISTRDGQIAVKNLQPEGKKRMDIEDFLRGIPDIGAYRINTAD